MASYNNYYGNIVYSMHSRKLSKLRMGIAMSGTSIDQRENTEQCCIMTQMRIYVVHCELIAIPEFHSKIPDVPRKVLLK